MYSFAARPRWIVLHVLVVFVVILFAVAGLWQLDRLADRRAHNAFVTERRDEPVVSIDDLFDDAASSEQRRVEARGRYDVGREVILRGRSNEGRPGNHVLTPLVMSGGRAVIVDRGWVPSELESSPVVEALPPERRVEVTGIVLPSEGRGPLGSGSAPTTDAVSRIDVAGLSKRLPYRTFAHYVVLRKQDPPQASKLPEPVSLAELSEGPHLVYAVQWFLFIPIALIGYGALLRRESRRRTGLPAPT